ncbi:MAG: helix-turn-helix transcriptional regulator [Lachnospiraceae bacterium]|nr:helix-turn-helix transcriptional regulator [Lachnospiraceae bacterium]
MDLVTIGNRIKQCRKNQNYTQESLAEKLDVSPHYIYEIERGSKTMSLKMLISISEALELSVDYILFGSRKESFSPTDDLDLLISELSPTQRKAATDILKAAILYIK